MTMIKIALTGWEAILFVLEIFGLGAFTGIGFSSLKNLFKKKKEMEKDSGKIEMRNKK